MKNLAAGLMLAVLRWASKVQLLKNPQAYVIGITGSAGKTSTREAVYAAMKDDARVKMCANGNSETGLPLDILGLKLVNYTVWDWGRILLMVPWQLLTNWERFDYMIAEMGIDSPDEPKNMGYLLKIVRPDIGIFLNVTSVHGQMFDKLISQTQHPAPACAGRLKISKHRVLRPVTRAYEQEILKLIAREKGRLITEMGPEGYAIVNLDDELVRAEAEKSKARVIGISANKALASFEVENQNPRRSNVSDLVFIDRVKISLSDGFECRYRVDGKSYVIKFKDHLLGPQYAVTFGSAFGAALAIRHLTSEVDPQKTKEVVGKTINSLENNFVLPPSRSSLLDGIRESKIIDSSYNSSKLAALDAIRLSKGLNAKHKIAVLGDMRELGISEGQVHVEVATAALEVFDEVMFVGPIFRKFLERLTLEVENPKTSEVVRLKKTSFFNCAIHAADDLKKRVKHQSLILVKGSQNTIFLEELVKQILANPEDAQKLCRQSQYWLRKKEVFFASCKE